MGPFQRRWRWRSAKWRTATCRSRRRASVALILAVTVSTVACAQDPPTYSLTAEDCADVRSLVDAGSSTVVAYDVRSEAELWRWDAGYSTIPPLAYAGVVFVVRTEPSRARSAIAALDPSTGSELWAQPIDGQVEGPYLLPYGTDSIAVALTSWNGPYAVVDVHGRRSEQTWQPITGSTLPLPDDPSRTGRLAVSRNQIELVDPDSGTTEWVASVPPLAGPATDIDIDVLPAGEVLVVRSHGVPTGVSGIDARTGAVLWTHSDAGLIDLIGLERSSPRSVVIAGSAGTEGLDPRSGEVVWTAADSGEADRRVAGSDSVPSPYLDGPDRWDPPDGPGRVVGGGVDLDGEGHAFVLRLSDATDDRFGARALVDFCAEPGASTSSTERPR